MDYKIDFKKLTPEHLTQQDGVGAVEPKLILSCSRANYHDLLVEVLDLETMDKWKAEWNGFEAWSPYRFIDIRGNMFEILSNATTPPVPGEEYNY